MDIKSYINKYSKYIVIVLGVLCSFLVFDTCDKAKENKSLIEEVEYIDSMNKYNSIYYDKEFSSLKKENKQLYDSLKEQKDKIDFLAQFKYEKEYSTGIVEIKHDTITKVIDNTVILQPKTYEYTSEPNDTFQYKLKINADVEPNWYSLNAKIRDTFTIINKKNEGGNTNHTTIESLNKGDISDVTLFNKKEKQKLFENFSIGPSVGAYYGLTSGKVDVGVGISITYNIFNK